MKRKTIRYLWIGLLGVLILCAGVFYWMTTYMVRESDRTINRVGEIYMEEMNRQLKLHFSSIIDLRLNRVEGIVERTPPESVEEYGPEMVEQLAQSARVRNFSYLAVYSTQGKADVVFGEPVSVINEKPFLESLNRNEKKVVVGTTASGENLLLLGISVGYPVSEGYPMSDGSRCTALVAGVSVDYINSAMSLEEDESLVFSQLMAK